MNAKRWIVGLLLGSFLLGQSLPATAGRMLCGMKERATVEACTRCDGDHGTPSTASLRGGNCCRIGQAGVVDATPVVLSGLRRTETGDRQVWDAVLPAVSGAGALPGNACAVLAAPPASPPPLEPSTRTTILRN